MRSCGVHVASELYLEIRFLVDHTTSMFVLWHTVTHLPYHVADVGEMRPRERTHIVLVVAYVPFE